MTPRLRNAPSPRVLAVVALLSSGFFASIGSAQEIMLQITLEPTASATGQGMAPEFLPALLVQGTFEGITRDTGDVVLRLDSAEDSNLAIEKLSKSQSIREVKKLTDSFDTIREVVAKFPADVSVPTDSFLGYRIIARYDPGNFVVLDIPDGIDSAFLNLFTSLRAQGVSGPQTEEGGILQPLFKYRLADASPDDFYFARGDLWGIVDTNAPKAWDKVAKAPALAIAIVDTGVLYHHPDLKANMWPGTRNHGYDFADEDADPVDTHGHGTACAGVIAGVGNNRIGIVGMLWSVQLMALKVFRTGENTTTDLPIIRAIDFAVENGAQIINCSFVNRRMSTVLYDAIVRAEKKGVLVVAAAGNDGRNLASHPVYPAAFQVPNVIAVAALRNPNALRPDSNFGPYVVHLAAPGTAILTTSRRGAFDYINGTSIAAPHVAGAAGLIWTLHPHADYAEIQELLIKNAKRTDALVGKVSSHGKLDLSFVR